MREMDSCSPIAVQYVCGDSIMIEFKRAISRPSAVIHSRFTSIALQEMYKKNQVLSPCLVSLSNS